VAVGVVTAVVAVGARAAAGARGGFVGVVAAAAAARVEEGTVGVVAIAATAATVGEGGEGEILVSAAATAAEMVPYLLIKGSLNVMIPPSPIQTFNSSNGGHVAFLMPTTHLVSN
jgi:hypothetical protein